MTPHERDEGFDYEGQREYNCRFGDPVVDSDREQDNARLDRTADQGCSAKSLVEAERGEA